MSAGAGRAFGRVFSKLCLLTRTQSVWLSLPPERSSAPASTLPVQEKRPEASPSSPAAAPAESGTWRGGATADRLRFASSDCRKGDAPQAPGLISGEPSAVATAGTAHDGGATRRTIADKGAAAVIPGSPLWARAQPLDRARNAPSRLIDAADHRGRAAVLRRIGELPKDPRTRAAVPARNAGSPRRASGCRRPSGRAGPPRPCRFRRSGRGSSRSPARRADAPRSGRG